MDNFKPERQQTTSDKDVDRPEAPYSDNRKEEEQTKPRQTPDTAKQQTRTHHNGRDRTKKMDELKKKQERRRRGV